MGVYKIFSKMIEYGLAMCSIYVSMVCVDSTLLLSQLVSSLLGVFAMYQVVVMLKSGRIRTATEKTLSGVKSLTAGVDCDIQVYDLSPVSYDSSNKKRVTSTIPEMILERFHFGSPMGYVFKLRGVGRNAKKWQKAIEKRSYLKLS